MEVETRKSATARTAGGAEPLHLAATKGEHGAGEEAKAAWFTVFLKEKTGNDVGKAWFYDVLCVFAQENGGVLALAFFFSLWYFDSTTFRIQPVHCEVG